MPSTSRADGVDGAIDLRSGRPQHRGDGVRGGSLSGCFRRPLRRTQTGGTIRPNSTLSGVPSARRIRSLRLDLKRVKLYQDSLPVCGHERALVHEICRPWAVETISSWRPLPIAAPRLSARNRRRSCSMNTGSFSRLNAPKRRRAALLDARDQFIAGRIDETLSDGEDRHLVHRRAAPGCKIPTQAHKGRIPGDSQAMTSQRRSSGEIHVQKRSIKDNREKLRLTVVEARRDDVGAALFGWTRKR